MTSKQRAYLKGLAMTMDPILQIGKSSLTPEITQSDDGKVLAAILAERTHSQVVQVIGKMIVLYKPAKEEKNRKILLPQQ